MSHWKENALNFIFFRFEKDPTLCRQVENPKNKIEVERGSPLTLDDNNQASGKFVQISPQRVRLKLRRNVKKTVKFRVAHAKQYPVDLYYLMDLSNSMSDDRDNIVSVGFSSLPVKRITQVLRN